MFDLRRRAGGRPWIVGHRGAMAVAPENTMPSFAAGAAAGADILELDVQLTADGQVVVFHDIELGLKTDLQGQVSEHTVERLRQQDVGAHFSPEFAGVRMPFLDEVLAWARGHIPLMIELKHTPPHFYPDLDTAVVQLIDSYDMVDQVIVTSFDQFALQRVKQLNPQIATSFIYVTRLVNPLSLVAGMKVDSLSPATDFLSEAEVTLIQEAGYACSPGGFYWDYPTLLAWGVDSISSNDPAALQQYIR